MRLSQVAAQRHRDPIETLFDLVLEDQGHTGAIYFLMGEPDVQAALARPDIGVNTDYGGVAPDGPFGDEGAHPRTYGSFARILGHYVRELHLLSLETAVHKMTALPAQRVHLADRGVLRPGAFADVTVFNPDSVADRATYERPHQASVGFAWVLVNGQVVLDHGRLRAARPGRGLRGPGWIQR